MRPLAKFFLGMVVLPLVAAASPSDRRLNYYCEFYEQCRLAFTQAARAYVATLPAQEQAVAQVGNWTVPSKIDAHLLTDYLYLPAREKTDNLIVISSGVHGIEAFAGSAIQQWFLRELLPELDRSHTGVVLIHAVNPYGFKYERRVSENNVDLNRNFDVNRKLFDVKNEGYAKMSRLLNPEGPASDSLLSYPVFFAKVGRLLLRQPLKDLRQAVLGGQYYYEYREGLYYGGRDFEPNKGIIETALVQWGKPYKNVLALDLHTGYGNRGVLHLFPNIVENQKSNDAAKIIFDGYKVENPTGEDFYTNYGDFSTYVANLFLGQGKLGVPMTLEYGTIGNLSYYGQIESIRRMINENQLHWHGAKGSFSEWQIKKQFREMYFPSSKKWRRQVMDVSVSEIPVFLSRFMHLDD